MTKTVKHRRGGALFGTRKAQVAPLQTIPSIFNFITEDNLTNVKAALKNPGWNRNDKNTDGDTAILHALYIKSKFPKLHNIDAIIKEIIADATGKKEVSLTVTDRDGYTPLLFAIDKGYDDIAKLLIAKGISLSLLSDTYKGETPLLLAIKYKQNKTVNNILTKIPNGSPLLATPNRDGKTPLLLAIEMGNSTIIQAILAKKVSLTKRQITADKKGNTPLLAALRKKNVATSTAILTDTSTLQDVDKDGYTPLLLAIENELSNSLITELIEKNIALVTRKGTDGKGDTPLLLAIKKNNKTIALKLIEQFPKAFYMKSTGLGDKDSDGKTPLQLAIEKGMKGVAEKLIDAKAEINTIDKDGNTPLLLLASLTGSTRIEGNDDAVVQKLIAAKVKLDVTNKDGETAVIVACKNNKPVIAEKLIKAGADVKKRSVTGRGAMYYCTNKIKNPTKRAAIQALLVEKGNAIEVNTSENSTAKTKGRDTVVGVSIINAIREGKPGKALDIITKSVAENAKTHFDIRSEDGSTPLIEAVKKGYENVIRDLLYPGKADINFKDKSGTTGFIEAIKRGDKAVIDMFIESPALQLDLSDGDGIHPLIWAFQKNNLDLVTRILNTKRINIKIIGPEALCYACDIRDKTQAKTFANLLLQKNANPNQKVTNGHYKNTLPADKCFSLWKDSPGVLQVLESVKLVTRLLNDIYYNKEAEALKLIEALVLQKKKMDLTIYKAALNTPNKYKYTPLGLAIYYGRNSIVEALLEAGADTEYVDENGNTPLHIAAHNTPILEYFLSGETEDKLFSKINTPEIINKKDKFDHTALYWLFKNKMESTAIKLLAKPDIEITDEVAVLSTIRWPDMQKANKKVRDMIDIAAKAKANANAKNQNAAQKLEAKRISNAQRTKEQKQIAADNAATPAELATQLTKAITDDPNKNESARLTSRALVLITLLSAKAPDEFKKVNNDGQTFLTWAVTKGNLTNVNALLAVNQSVTEENKFINIKTRERETPLMIACRSKQNEIAQALVNAGADRKGTEDVCKDMNLVAMVDTNNVRPLPTLPTSIEPTSASSAVPNELKDILENSDHILSEANTTLFTLLNEWPSSITYTEYLDYLVEIDRLITIIKESGNTIIVDEKGDTPFHIIARKNIKITKNAEPLNNPYDEILAHLITQGLDINSKNREEKTPLQVACDVKNTSLALALIEKGARIFDDDLNDNITYCKDPGVQEAYRSALKSKEERNGVFTEEFPPVRSSSVSPVPPLIAPQEAQPPTSKPLTKIQRGILALQKAQTPNQLPEGGLRRVGKLANRVPSETTSTLSTLSPGAAAARAAIGPGALAMRSVFNKKTIRPPKLPESPAKLAEETAAIEKALSETPKLFSTDKERLEGGQVLIAEIRKGAIANAITLIKKGADLSVKESSGTKDSALIKACKKNNLKLVTAILDRLEVDPNRVDILNYANTDDERILDLLVKKVIKKSEAEADELTLIIQRVINLGATVREDILFYFGPISRRGTKYLPSKLPDLYEFIKMKINAAKGGHRKTRHRKIRNHKTPRRSTFKTQKRR
jgi:ankyrin repeat protein